MNEDIMKKKKELKSKGSEVKVEIVGLDFMNPSS
jgi:hypothetical protein